MGRDDFVNKPDNIRLFRSDWCAPERDDGWISLYICVIKNITVEELVAKSVAPIGENIQVRRFVRSVLGEGIEKQE